MANTRTQLSFRLDPKLHQSFKLLCVQKHTTMKAYITDLIRKEVETSQKESHESETNK